MTHLNGLNISNFISFKGNATQTEGADKIKTSEPKGATLPPVLKQDTFVKSTPSETSKIEQYNDDYDEEYEKEQAKWLQERLSELDKAAQNLENQTLEELRCILELRLSLQYEAPEAEPSLKTVADTIISKLDKESVDTKEAADIWRLMSVNTDCMTENADRELSRIIAHASILLHSIGQERYQANFDTLQEAFKDINAEFSGRVKTAKSIEEKIPHRIKNNLRNGENLFNATSDICGYRLVTDGSNEQGEKIMERIEKLTKDGKYTLFLISSHGENPYISKDEIERLHDEKGFGYTIKQYPGFTGTNIILKDKEDKKLEIQIIGKEVNKINIKEHKFYKLWTLSEDEYRKYFTSRRDIGAYEEYMYACYAYARGLELGTIDKNTEKPELPEGLCEDLRLI